MDKQYISQKDPNRLGELILADLESTIRIWTEALTLTEEGKKRYLEGKSNDDEGIRPEV